MTVVVVGVAEAEFPHQGCSLLQRSEPPSATRAASKSDESIAGRGRLSLPLAEAGHLL